MNTNQTNSLSVACNQLFPIRACNTEFFSVTEKVKIVWLVAVACMMFSTAKASLVTTFGSGLEGWTSPTATAQHVATGGNLGGFLSLTDIVTGDNMWIDAPPAFLGNLSAYLGGTFSFDAKNLNGVSANLATFGTVTIVGTFSTASKVLGGTGNPPPDGLWHTYSALLAPGDWSGDLTLALNNVTEIKIVLESHSTVAEVNGFDSFTITEVPEPSPALLGVVSTLTVTYLRNRRK